VLDAVPALLLAAPLLAAVLAALAGLRSQLAAKVLAITGAATAFGLAAWGLLRVLADGTLVHHLGGWAPPLGIEYVLDPLSAFMAVVVTFIGLVVIAYPVRPGFGEAPARGVPLHALALLLVTGLLGVVLSGDLFHLFVFLEVYSIASYGLIALGGDRAAFASFRYLIFGTIGSGLYLLGVGFVYFTTGTLNMADAATLLPALAGTPTLVGAGVLIVVGLGVKTALFPLHVWLPDAHSYAPPSVAALLAAVQVKVGAYALVRILFDVFQPAGAVPATTLLAWFGVAGVVVGSLVAITQSDFKRLLAYSTVAQLGYIGLGIGLANPLALVGALLHVLNHAFMKCCLFLIAGGVLQQTGLKAIPRFAGLGRRMPWTMTGFALAALAMIGVPPTAGFFSKWYLVLGSLDDGRWLFAVAIVASSLLTATYFLRVFERVFMAAAPDEAVAGATEAGPGVVVPILVLAAGTLVLGLANVPIVTGLLDGVAASLLDG
jgi:multicomponent Na+:H+ antiporter subunit D